MTRSLNQHVFALAGAFALLIPNLAQADKCHDEIARAQKLIEQAKAGAAEVPDLPQSDFATMHRQPTRESIAQAKGEATERASALLDQARKQEAEGHPAECLKTLRTIVMP